MKIYILALAVGNLLLPLSAIASSELRRDYSTDFEQQLFVVTKRCIAQDILPSKLPLKSSLIPKSDEVLGLKVRNINSISSDAFLQEKYGFNHSRTMESRNWRWTF